MQPLKNINAYVLIGSVCLFMIPLKARVNTSHHTEESSPQLKNNIQLHFNSQWFYEWKNSLNQGIIPVSVIPKSNTPSIKPVLPKKPSTPKRDWEFI